MLIHAATDNDILPPLFGAAQRTFGLARGLARGHEVRVLCVVPNRSRGASEERADGVTVVRRRAWYTSVAWRLERLRLAPLFTAAAIHDARARALLEALPGEPDVLAADLHLTGLLRHAGGALKVHTSHNVEVDHFREAGPPLLARGAWVERRRAREAAAVRMADLTVVCGPEDAGRMRALYGVPEAHLLVIPNGYDETRVRPATAEERRRSRAALGIPPDDYVGLFLGSDVPHNRAALARLLALGPALAPAGVRLLVVGSVTRALPAALPAGVHAHAATPDVAPLLAAADAGLNPVTAGGGSNVKIPTYLAAGLAVITTPFGLRGYPDLEPWVTLAGSGEFAEALRERPAGWPSRLFTTPSEIAAYAWGRLGERLGERLEERRHGGAPVRQGRSA